MIEDLELKAILEETLKQTIQELKEKMPEELSENDPNAITITYQFKDNTFTRRFSILNTILVTRLIYIIL